MHFPALRGFDFRRTAVALAPFLVLVFIHLLFGMQMEQPLILADELGYLGNARYLSGTAHLPNMQKCQFYHFGYSLFLFPAFWLFTEPLATYKAAIAINALLSSALYFPLHFVLISFLKTPRIISRWIAFICCLFPPIMLYSNYALSENIFTPLYAVSVALLGCLLASKSCRDALLFGFSVGFLYTVHPRALPVLVIVLIYLIVLAWLKVLPKTQIILSVSTMVFVFLLTRVINIHLRTVGWSGGGEFSVTKLAGRLLPGSNFPTLIQRAVGQVLYMSQATHGLFLIGLVAVVLLLIKNTKSKSLRRVMADPRTGVPIFALITACGIFLASCALKIFSLHGPHGIRGADFIHGRYNEPFAVLFLAFGLAELCRKGLQNRQLARLLIGVTAAILFMTVITAIEVNDALKKHGGPGAVPREAVLSSEVDIINVAGVFPLVRIAGELDLLFISLVSIGLLFAITVVMRRSQRAGMALLMLVFSFFSLYNFRNRVLHSTARNRPRLAFASLLSRLGPIRTISYDVAHPEPRLFYGTQYLLQHTVFDRFDSRRGEEPRSDVVISGNNWKQARRLGARFVVSAGGRHNALWVLPGEVQSRLPTISYEGVILGAEPVFGVQESGFHRRERSGGGPARWTTGAATLRVPLDPRDLPQVLEIEAVGPARQGGPNLQVFANGVELWNGRILGVWSRSLSLSQVPLGDSLQIDLKSDTFIPYESTEGSGDRRRLGVMVKGIRLQARARPAAEAYTGVTLGAEPVSGIQETGFHRVEQIGGTPARWTNGAASLQVPLDPANLPQSFEIETAAPGRTGARLQLLANGVELWHQKTPPHAWTQTFSLEQVPMEDELFIELNSDTFVPAESLEGSGDQRRLGVVVKGIRVQARESTEQQPENGSTR